jgi:hypothetical protein
MSEDYRTLKERAARAGMSLPDYLLAELRKSKEKITPEELWQRIRSRPPIPGISGADLVREKSAGDRSMSG